MLVRNLINQNWRTQINGIVYNFDANGVGINVPDFFRDLIKKGNLGSRLKEVREISNLYIEDEEEKPTQNIPINETTSLGRLSSVLDLEEEKLLEAEAENIKKVNEDIKKEILNKPILQNIDDAINIELEKQKEKKKKAKKKKAKKKKEKNTIDNYIVKED